MEDLSTYYVIVEQALAMTGVDPAQCRSDDDGQWNLKTGNTELWIDIWYVEQEDRNYFQVMSPFCELPEEDKEVFLQEIMEHNYNTIDAHFVLANEIIYLKSIREIDYLVPEAMLLTINRVGYYGMMFENKLFEKYSLKRPEHE